MRAAHLLERHRRGRTMLCHLDDVVAELRRDDVADFARLERERRLIERRDHLALGEEVRVATLLRAAVGRVLLRELGEVARRRAPASGPLRPGPCAFFFVAASALSSTRNRMWLARTASSCLNLSGFLS